ncbi:MAG: SGNH/GDSL hydrolase family protein [Lachnospiraceae bacterium]|nr:SGNH/GDSL hydrolase family protein [Lachnospiraceae bacterium]
MELKRVGLSEDERILVRGRTVASRNPAVLLWGGSSVDLTVRCSELWVELAGPFAIREVWIAIEINGEIMARQMVSPERSRICIFRGKSTARPSRVRIIKEAQAMNDETEHRLEVYAFYLDGEVLETAPKKRRIEFIGDSINSGEGARGAVEEDEWIPLYFSHTHAYPYMVAKELDADYRVVSQGGWGLYVSWDNRRQCNIPRIYREICSVTVPDFAVAGLHEANDFAAWQPDVIVVNLGTNDNGAFHNVPFVDPESGESFKMHMSGEHFENGNFIPGTDYEPEDLKKVSDAATAFLATLRECNPKAHIIWAFGILGSDLAPAIQAGIEEYKKQSGDGRVEFLPIPDTTPETVGSCGHPGVKAHRLAAEVIAARIAEICQ